MDLLVPDGRRMVLTPAGEALLRDARPLLDTAFRLERRARTLLQGGNQSAAGGGWTGPTAPLLAALAAFAAQCPATRLQLHEEILSAPRTPAARRSRFGAGDLVPPGFLATPSPKPNSWRWRALTSSAPAARVERRDPGKRQFKWWCAILVPASRATRAGCPSGAGRSAIRMALALVSAGLAFSWLPRHSIREQLDTGQLLPFAFDQRRPPSSGALPGGGR